MSKILITGANGQLGNEFRTLSQNSDFEFVFTDVAELDITKEADVLEFVRAGAFDFIVNCAAYTAVDKAESDQELADLINAKAPGYLAEAAKKSGAKFIHVSTDYVFDGNACEPYTEHSYTLPIGEYGRSKLRGENYVDAVGADSMVIRTSWLYSSFGNNFVKTMLRLGGERDSLNVVADQIGSPTYAGDLAEAIYLIIAQTSEDASRFVKGLYHFSNEGVASWYDFAFTIMEMAGITCVVNPIPSKMYPTPTKRPLYSVLNKDKIKATYGIKIPHWRTSLQKCIEILEPLNS